MAGARLRVRPITREHTRHPRAIFVICRAREVDFVRPARNLTRFLRGAAMREHIFWDYFRGPKGQWVDRRMCVTRLGLQPKWKRGRGGGGVEIGLF